jgi:hypothetical protein
LDKKSLKNQRIFLQNYKKLDAVLSLGLGLGLFWVTVAWVTVVRFLDPTLFLGLGLGLFWVTVFFGLR